MDLELQYENIVETNKNITNGLINNRYGSVEDAEFLMQQRDNYFKEEQLLNNILTKANNEMPFVNDIVDKNYGTRYNYFINTLEFYKDDLDRSSKNLANWDSYRSDVQNEVEHHFSLMNSILDSNAKYASDRGEKSSLLFIPEFSDVFVLIGISAVLFFFKKNRQE